MSKKRTRRLASFADLGETFDVDTEAFFEKRDPLPKLKLTKPPKSPLPVARVDKAGKPGIIRRLLGLGK